MDGVAAGFVLLMVLVGGLSAYVADILGFKIGKKRLSFLRIRPKHVAQITVTIAGMLIPLVTIGLVSILSSDVRTWLVEGREAIRKLQSVNQELDAAENQVVEKEKQKAKLENTNRLIGSELKNKQDEVLRQDEKVKNLNATLEMQRGQLSATIAKVTSAETRIKQLNIGNAETKKQFAETKRFLVAEQNRLVKVQGELAVAVTTRNKATEEAKKAFDEYNQTNKRNLELDQQNLALSNQLTQLKTNIDKLEKDLLSLRKENEATEGEAEQLRTQIKEISQEIEKLNSLRMQAEEAATRALLSRLQKNTYLLGEELTRMIVPGGMSVAESRNLLTTVQRQSRILAEQKGAKADPDAPFEGAAGLYAFQENGKLITPKQQEERIIQKLTNGDRTRILVVRANMNRFVGEPVSVAIDIYDNPIVFREGAILAETRVDGRKSDVEIFAVIRDFVSSSVNDRAKRAKMIPVNGRDGESFGELSASDILQTLALIRSAPRLLRLQAIAREDIRVGDSLKFDLVIK